jgi:hypothetical protein
MGRLPPLRPLALPGAVTFLAGLLLACKAGTELHLVDVSGAWQYSETYTDIQHSISCTDSGSYSLIQAGATFSGRYFQRGVCHTPTISTDNTDSGTVWEGHIVGRTLTFHAPNCAYDGAVDAESRASIAGRVECTLTDPTHLYRFSGTWQANR